MVSLEFSAKCPSLFVNVSTRYRFLSCGQWFRIGPPPGSNDPCHTKLIQIISITFMIKSYRIQRTKSGLNTWWTTVAPASSELTATTYPYSTLYCTILLILLLHSYKYRHCKDLKLYTFEPHGSGHMVPSSLRRPIVKFQKSAWIGIVSTDGIVIHCRIITCSKVTTCSTSTQDYDYPS